MKKILAMILSVLIVAGILGLPVFADEGEDAAEAALSAFGEDAEAPAAEETDPDAEPAGDAEAPAGEIAATAAGEDAEAPAEEDAASATGEDAEAPAAEEEEDEEEEAPAPAFAGRLASALAGGSTVTASEGDTVIFSAAVADANMGYVICWERLDSEAEDGEWESVIGEEEFSITVTEDTSRYAWRVRVIAEDETELICGPFTVTVAQNTQPGTEPAEAPAGEPAEEPAGETASEAGEDAEAPADPAEPAADEPEEEPVVIVPVQVEVTVVPAVVVEVVPMTVELPAAAEAAEPAKTPSEELAAQPEAPAAAVEADGPQTIVLEGGGEFAGLDVREEADGMSAIFASLPEGAEVTVLSIEGDWALVLADGREGYVFAADLAAWLDLPEPEEDAVPERRIFIFCSRRTQMTEGEEVWLTSRIEGYEGLEIMYQWECDRHDGLGFTDVEGANGDSFAFRATVETLSWDWRLSVYYR